jgi:hypothetical protein
VGGVQVHPRPAASAQDRPHRPVVDSEVDGPTDRRRERDKYHLAALAHHAQDAVPVLLAQIHRLVPRAHGLGSARLLGLVR